MDGASETESQNGRDSRTDGEVVTVPNVITEEYFNEITSKFTAVSAYGE